MNLSYRFWLPPFFFVSFIPYFAIVHNWYVFTMCLVGRWIKVCVEFYCSARFLSVLTWNPSTFYSFITKQQQQNTHARTLLVALRSLSFFSFYKSLKFISEISATYREICSASRYLNWLICSQLRCPRNVYHFHEQCQTVVRATVIRTVCLSIFSLEQCIMQQLFDSVFVISGIVKVSVSVISLGIRLGW